MSEKKFDQAIRLFETLDGVDPELLARSEKEKKVIPFQRYVRVAASFFALLAAGGLCWMTVRNVGSKDAAENATAKDSAHFMASDISSVAESNIEKEAEEDRTPAMFSDETAGEAAPAMYGESAEEFVTNAQEAEGVMYEEQEQNENPVAEKNDAKAQGSSGSNSVKSFLQSLGLWKNDAEMPAVRGAFDRYVVVQFDASEITYSIDQNLAAQIYDYISELQVTEVDDGIATQAQGQERILLQIYEGSAQSEEDPVETYELSGNILTKGRDAKKYIIEDEEYDFAVLRAELERIARGEE